MSEHQDEPVVEEDVSHDSGHEPADGGPGDSIHIDKFEGAWIRISVVVVLVFIIAVTVSSFAVGVQLPGQYARIQPEDFSDPNNPFSDPGLRELAPGKYEAYITAQTWSFVPSEIRIPVGSEITFYVTARDVQHGFKLLGTNVNMMVLPGQISSLKAVFDEPGTYDFICHEYCGYVEGSPIGHHTMYGQVIVEDPAAETAASE
jgi:cytochrome c oxidase subunit 2